MVEMNKKKIRITGTQKMSSLKINKYAQSA